MRQCNPDLVQRLGIAAAGAVMLGKNGVEVRRAMIRKAVSQAMPGLRRPGRALRLAAGLTRAAVEFVLGRAICGLPYLLSAIASRQFWSVCSCVPDASMVAQPTWPIL